MARRSRLAAIRKRLPVPLRQNWKLLTAGVAVLAVGLTVFGQVTIRPYSTSANAATDQETITQDIAGTVDLFDDSVSHEISLSFSTDDYDRMLDTYFSEGEKEWMTADITIDGTTIDSVAIRLKGNSTLSSLTDGRAGSPTEGERAPGGMGAGGAGGGPGGGELPDGFEPPEGMELPEGFEPPAGGMPDGGGMPEGGRMPGGDAQQGDAQQGDAQSGDAQQGGFAGTGATLSTEEPEALPILVSFNEYQEGRAYQGRTELSVRPASASYASAINEAVGLELTAQSGQTTQDSAYTTYTVNDRPSTTRLVVENPDFQYASALEGDGVLYKLLSTSEFAYQGQDQTEYTDDFKQVNLVGSQDLQPIVSFLEWLENASDEEFSAELDEWIDTESFAEYLATQDLLGNFDTISGPGRNAYLYYDLDTRLISVVSWDLNLALGGMSMGGMAMGGGMPGQEQDGQDADAGTQPQAPDAGAQPPQNGGAPGGGAMQMPGSDNALVTRFQDDAGFAALVDEAAARLRADWTEASLDDLVDAVAARIPASDALTQATIDEETTSVREQLASSVAEPETAPQAEG